MRASKIFLSLMLAFGLVVPAVAQAKDKDSSNMSEAEAKEITRQAVDSVPTDTGGNLDLTQIRLTRKEYMDQLSRSFDAMDANGDGVIEGPEMAGVQKAVSGEANDYNKIPQAASASSATGGVPPINSRELNKN